MLSAIIAVQFGMYMHTGSVLWAGSGVFLCSLNVLCWMDR